MRPLHSFRPLACKEPERNRTKTKSSLAKRKGPRPDIFCAVVPAEPTEAEFGRGGERSGTSTRVHRSWGIRARFLKYRCCSAAANYFPAPFIRRRGSGAQTIPGHRRGLGVTSQACSSAWSSSCRSMRARTVAPIKIFRRVSSLRARREARARALASMRCCLTFSCFSLASRPLMRSSSFGMGASVDWRSVQ
jgi:hypothetical protein